MPWTKFIIEKEESGFDASGENKGRRLTFSQAVFEALDQALGLDPNVYIMGQGVDDPTGMFGTTLGLHKKYGRARVFDTPLSENCLTGVAIGSALVGMRPVYIHNRPDFLLLTMDQIVNHAAKWSYMFGGHLKVPLVIRSVIGRGWGSAAQHSQALYALFMHVPGLKVVLPSTAYDVKGLLLSSIADNNPVIFIEHRWLYKHSQVVPKKIYFLPLGKGVIRRQGRDVTIVGISYMVIEALRAAEQLAAQGIEAEVIDLRTIKPLDEQIIIDSIKKTGRLIVAEMGWKMVGLGSEIAARILEKGPRFLKAPLVRIASPECPTPSSHVLEAEFYPGAEKIIKAVKEVMANI